MELIQVGWGVIWDIITGTVACAIDHFEAAINLAS